MPRFNIGENIRFDTEKIKLLAMYLDYTILGSAYITNVSPLVYTLYFENDEQNKKFGSEWDSNWVDSVAESGYEL